RVENSRPSPVWMDMAATGRAKQAIRRALRAEEREEHIRQGREIARLAFERRDLAGGDKAVATAARKLGMGDAANVFAALGAGELSGRRLVGAVYPGILDAEPELAEDMSDRPHHLVVGAPKGEDFFFADCCQPIPGERIVGLRTKRGIEAHCIDCATLIDFEESPEAWVDLRWDEDAAHLGGRTTSVDISLANQAGVLGVVATLIGDHKANIENISTVERAPDYWRLRMSLTVRDVKHLSTIITALEAQTIVTDVKRTRIERSRGNVAELSERRGLSA
ncbi:MAG: RelA/SpoT AH/RIS domain-containing protein, partial [Pseudomonadota bacterium]